MALIDISTKKFPHTFVKIDDEDFEELSQYRWSPAKREHGMYAIRHAPNGKMILMHRQIMKVRKGFYVDHRNADGLNNTKSNLRVCTNSQNMQNIRPRTDGLSKFKGVGWTKRSGGKWRAYIQKDGKHIHLGYFDEEVIAARAYDLAAKRLFGEFSRVNGV